MASEMRGPRRTQKDHRPCNLLRLAPPASGTAARIAASASGCSAATCWPRTVWTKPGATAFTRIPCLAYCRVALFVRPETPLFCGDISYRNQGTTYFLGKSPLSFLLTGPSLRAYLDLSDQLFHGLVNDLLAGAAEPLVTDHTFVVEEVNRRGAGEVPFLGDATPACARLRVAERPPGKVLLLH